REGGGVADSDLPGGRPTVPPAGDLPGGRPSVPPAGDLLGGRPPVPSFAIAGGRVVPIDGGTIVIVDGKIAAVGGPDLKPPPGMDVIDAAGRWVLPGLVDAHTHLGARE